MSREQPSYSVFARVLWLPLFSAPFTYTAPRILLPAALIGTLAGVIAGIDAGLKVAAIDWIFACWLVSFTYGRRLYTRLDRPGWKDLHAEFRTVDRWPGKGLRERAREPGFSSLPPEASPTTNNERDEQK